MKWLSGAMLRIGSLCTGYGGLDMAAEAYFNAETIWTCEFDKHASKVIEARINKPNHGNLKTTDWSKVEPIDILTAGYPCQPFSHAGSRKGVEDERHLWPFIKDIIGILRPQFVLLENVRGHFGLGFREVLSDLTSIGYDARWKLIRASEVGAPHRRERLFILAHPVGSRCSRTKSSRVSTAESRFAGQDTDDKYTHTDGQRCYLGQNYGDEVEHQGQSQLIASGLVETITANTNSVSHDNARRTNRNLLDQAGEVFNGADRGESRSSTEAIPDTNNGRRLGSMQGLQKRYDPCSPMYLQEIPTPLDQGKLNVKFVEYMMGLPNGWVTDVELPRAQMLKILGNGVVPQQAYRALEILMSYE